MLKPDDSEMREKLKKQQEDRPGEKSMIRFADDDVAEQAQSDELYIMLEDFLPQLDEFFQQKQSVVLVDLETLAAMTPAESNVDSEIETEIKVQVEKTPRKKLEIQETPIPEVSPVLKALIDKNLLEIFKFYSKKHLN